MDNRGINNGNNPRGRRVPNPNGPMPNTPRPRAPQPRGARPNVQPVRGAVPPRQNVPPVNRARAVPRAVPTRKPPMPAPQRPVNPRAMQPQMPRVQAPQMVNPQQMINNVPQGVRPQNVNMAPNMGAGAIPNISPNPNINPNVAINNIPNVNPNTVPNTNQNIVSNANQNVNVVPNANLNTTAPNAMPNVAPQTPTYTEPTQANQVEENIVEPSETQQTVNTEEKVVEPSNIKEEVKDEAQEEVKGEEVKDTEKQEAKQEAKQEGEVVDFKKEKKKIKEKKIKEQKNKGRGRKKMIGILVAIFVGIIAIGGLVLGLSISNKTYRVSFVTGPFDEIQSLTVKNGEIPGIADIEDIMSLDETPKPLVEFTGWYLDETRTRKYEPQRIYQDLTLYAGYELGTVTTSFYMANEYSEDGSFVYLTEIETEYYTGEIDFDSLESSIMNLDSKEYLQASNVMSFDPVSYELGTLSIELSDYKLFLDNYFTIDNFVRWDDGSYEQYNIGDAISTPNKDAIFLVNFTPNDVTLIFNSNKSSLKDFYDKTEIGSSDCVDTQKTITVEYGKEYEIPSYATISSGDFGEYPEYHTPYGWSLDRNALISDGENENLIYQENNTIKIDRKFLNNKTSAELFALWVEGMTPLRIYTELDNCR